MAEKVWGGALTESGVNALEERIAALEARAQTLEAELAAAKATLAKFSFANVSAVRFSDNSGGYPSLRYTFADGTQKTLLFNFADKKLVFFDVTTQTTVKTFQ